MEKQLRFFWRTALLFALLLTLLSFSALAVSPPLVTAAPHWQEVSFDEANALIDKAKEGQGDDFILLYYSRDCSICQICIPAYYEYAGRTGALFYALDRENTLGGTATAFTNKQISGTLPFLYAYNGEARQLAVQENADSITRFAQTLHSIGQAAPFVTSASHYVSPDRKTYLGYLGDADQPALPDSISTISYKAFAHYTGHTIFIPDSVTTIEAQAFKNCQNLATVYFSGTQYQWDAIAIGSGNEALLQAELVLPSLPFTDVKSADWFFEAVHNVYLRGTFHGTSDTTFSPNATTTRAMLVTLLHRIEAQPLPSGENPFSDVPPDQWYTNAVLWAYENQIVSGMSGDTFAPLEPVTREQMAVMLSNYLTATGQDLSQTQDDVVFSDEENLSQWARDAVHAMYTRQILSGNPNGSFNPQGSASRAEAAAVLYNYLIAAGKL